MVVLPVIERTPPQIELRQVKDFPRNQRLMGAFRDSPLVPGDRLLLLRFDTGLPGLAEKRVPEVNRVFQDPFYRRIVPQIRGSAAPLSEKLP